MLTDENGRKSYYLFLIFDIKIVLQMYQRNAKFVSSMYFTIDSQ